ncbi:MAG: ribonuclease III [Armatimonadota bacterium]
MAIRASNIMTTDPTAQCQALQQRLGITFQRCDLLVQALTHRSYLAETPDAISNERLEFLGDAVLDLVVAEELFRRHPDWPEGELTKAKASAVDERALERMARDWELGEYVLVSRGEEQSGGRQRRAMLADAVEALIGAYFLDQGLDAVREFVLRALAPVMAIIERREHEHDYKTLLQELFQSRYQTAPVYEVLSETGPPHDRTFEIGVTFAGQVLGRGTGKSKKEAAQSAAAEALQNIPEREHSAEHPEPAGDHESAETPEPEDNSAEHSDPVETLGSAERSGSTEHQDATS